jgi:hypothetical protein
MAAFHMVLTGGSSSSSTGSVAILLVQTEPAGTSKGSSSCNHSLELVAYRGMSVFACLLGGPDLLQLPC